MAAKVHPDAYKGLGKTVSGFKAAYGTVMFFEDQVPLYALAAKNPLGDVSDGMHQYLVWTALELEGLGANLQHFNFMDEFSDEVAKRWDLPTSWKLKSQLVFGKPANGLVRKSERTYAPLQERVRLYG
ncbi:putative nitroreductase [Saxophila tyrrhenica]|uniref:Nitroreductase n=1 Tax=Saxophila tyrrhenica TaxID=1690608 RepID=A0AAV9PFR1_9PEZI|nr:putative nitroreductase [Saxophila tyrrhenica]